MTLPLVVLALLMSTPAGAGPQVKPGDAEVHVDRATALYGKGDLDGAIAELREGIRLKPDLAEAHLDLAAALAGKGDRKAALEECRKAAQLNLTPPAALLYRAVCEGPGLGPR